MNLIIPLDQVQLKLTNYYWLAQTKLGPTHMTKGFPTLVNHYDWKTLPLKLVITSLSLEVNKEKTLLKPRNLFLRAFLVWLASFCQTSHCLLLPNILTSSFLFVVILRLLWKYLPCVWVLYNFLVIFHVAFGQ